MLVSDARFAAEGAGTNIDMHVIAKVNGSA